MVSFCQGVALYDERFGASMNLLNLNRSLVTALCRLCLAIANNTELVVPQSAQCRPAVYSRAYQSKHLNLK